jgi:hypothetical protein
MGLSVPHSAAFSSTHSREISSFESASGIRTVEGGDADRVPARILGAHPLKVRGRVVGVADRENLAALVGGKRVGGVPQRFRDATRLIEHDEQLRGVVALKRAFIVVGGFTPDRYQVVVDEPFGLVDTPDQLSAAVDLTDVAPQHATDLGVGGCGGDDERFTGRVDRQPPGHNPGGVMRLAHAMA